MTNAQQSKRFRWLKLTAFGRDIAMRFCQDALKKTALGRDVMAEIDLQKGSFFVTLPAFYDQAAFIQHPINASIPDGDLDHQAIDELVNLIIDWRLDTKRNVLIHTSFRPEYVPSYIEYWPYLLVYEESSFARATTSETQPGNAMEFIWRFERLTPYNLFFFDVPLVLDDPSATFGVPILTHQQALNVVKNTQMISTMAFDGAGYILWTRRSVESPKECC